MNILIVDDEPLARRRLRSLLESLPEHRVVGEAGNGLEALEACQRLRPEALLLDIRMPGLDGLSVAAQLVEREEPPAVIFVTAFGDHALAAFDTAPVDYLLKPVRRERLAEALRKARRLNRAQLDALTEARARPAEGEPREHLLCRRRGVLELIPVENIRYLQADQKYVTVNHLDGEDLIEESLRKLEQEFDERFVRIHRNALVARRYLAGLDRSPDGRSVALIRDCEDRLDVSRRHLPELRRLIRQMGDR